MTNTGPGGAREVLAEEARGRGGARSRVGRYLDGRTHLVWGEAPYGPPPAVQGDGIRWG